MFRWGRYSLVERFSLFYFLATLIILVLDVEFLKNGRNLCKTSVFLGNNSVLLCPISLAEVNVNRMSVLTTYKKGLLEKSKKVSRMKKSLYKLISQTRMKSERDCKYNNKYSSLLMNKVTRVKTDGGIVEAVLNLIKEQVKLVELLLEVVIMFWDPVFNYGIDISSQSKIDHSFLDMLGLGDKGLWDTDNYGGKVSKAIDTDLGSSDSLFKILGSIEMYRYLMTYNYLLIIGLIYRKGKNFERNIRSKLRLFHNVREGLISSRDSLSLLLDSDLPGDISFPHPKPSPSYLDVGANCDLKTYNEIREEINFFRRVQDESKIFSDKIKSSECTHHDFRGCNSCEIKKTSILIIEWSMNDIQMDIERLEKDLKLCFENIRKSNKDFCFDEDGKAISCEDTSEGKSVDFVKRATGSSSSTGVTDLDMQPDFSAEKHISVTSPFVSDYDSSLEFERVENVPSKKKTLVRMRNKRYTKRSVVSKLVRRTSKRRSQRYTNKTGCKGRRRGDRDECDNPYGSASHTSVVNDSECDSSSVISDPFDTETSIYDSELSASTESEVLTEASGKLDKGLSSVEKIVTCRSDDCKDLVKIEAEKTFDDKSGEIAILCGPDLVAGSLSSIGGNESHLHLVSQPTTNIQMSPDEVEDDLLSASGNAGCNTDPSDYTSSANNTEEATEVPIGCSSFSSAKCSDEGLSEHGANIDSNGTGNTTSPRRFQRRLRR
ncbi:hypothetical protein FG379_002416 [Cryptosporidium bovis]|uniref:uncharacterized protein n=1 Tax=Cryptosporidium bovis TaxID=310047 RepID=UPI00351AB10F|nr:hypothetical protein FG379_002416 [Cryptosporidium bovis]